jgi:hypothetical protein
MITETEPGTEALAGVPSRESKGDRYTCKKCSDRIKNGERLKIRSYQPNAPRQRMAAGGELNNEGDLK